MAARAGSAVRYLFATPFAYEMAGEAIDLPALRQAITDEHARDPVGLTLSNTGGWHSNTRMTEWGGEAALALARKAAAMADALTFDSLDPDANHRDWRAEMWANVSGRGHASQYHFHPRSYWSAVAYVDDGYEGSDDPDLGGELQLIDPRMPAIRMAAPDLRLKEADGKMQPNEVAVRPRSGLIVLFPSWLQHGVRLFRGPGTRLSIAINLAATGKAP